MLNRPTFGGHISSGSLFQNDKKPIYKLIEISTRNKTALFQKLLQI